jgi:response regulator RpfG family c-di-GMP phosphodiesterase
VGIPDSILNKAGQLTKEEFELIKSHTTLGYNILHNSKRDILRTAAIVAYEHHEKYDGTGYPRGLKKDEIHIFGRITAVADVFDALGHDRVYKQAWKLDDILSFFKQERGKHFDPILVDLLFDNLDEFLKIKIQLEDIVPS